MGTAPFIPIRTLKKYPRTIVAIIIALWALFTPSQFQKGGVTGSCYIAIALFVTLVSFLIASITDINKSKEVIFMSFLFSFISLVLTTFFIVPKIIEYFYGDAIWALWKFKHRIFTNTIYYGLNAIILAFLSMLYFRGKKKIRGSLENPESID